MVSNIKHLFKVHFCDVIMSLSIRGFFCYSDIDVHAQFAVNQSRPEEITMREDLGNITLVGDDGFGNKTSSSCNCLTFCYLR
jgi:hypothetical protein